MPSISSFSSSFIVFLDKLSFSCGKETEPSEVHFFLPEVGNAFHYAFNFLLKKRKGVVKNISIKLLK
jgi:hypothetical protein